MTGIIVIAIFLLLLYLSYRASLHYTRSWTENYTFMKVVEPGKTMSDIVEKLENHKIRYQTKLRSNYSMGEGWFEIWIFNEDIEQAKQSAPELQEK